MQFLPEDLTALLSDLESFLSDGLKAESLSKKAKEKKDAFLRRIKEVKASFPQDFMEKQTEESDEVDEVDSNDAASLHSERTDKDEESAYDTRYSPPVAAQELQSVFKAGYLEKRRKDYSFFGTEWQKRWCALSSRTFYYYGSEKDKQQKGDFCIDGYTVKMNYVLRKDAKKDCCFEISAPDKRVYQFSAASQKDAEEWVEQIRFVLKDLGSGFIPEDDEEQYDDVGNTCDTARKKAPTPATSCLPTEDDIYEELPEEELPSQLKTFPEPGTKASSPAPVDKSTDYRNYYQGKWDCSADHADELSFKRGDAIYILSKEYQNFGWWVGELKGSVGIVPKDYLMELYAL